MATQDCTGRRSWRVTFVVPLHRDTNSTTTITWFASSRRYLANTWDQRLLRTSVGHSMMATNTGPP